MKAERYPLDVVIKLRQEDLDEAQRIFSKAVAATRAAKNRVQQARRAVERAEKSILDIEKRFRAVSDTPVTAARHLDAYRARRTLLDNRLDEAKRKLGEEQRILMQAENQEEAARAALAETRKELEVVERHKEKWTKTRRARRLAAEDELAEELAARIDPEPR